MRLTLRTMLAYLDGILEPADSTELTKKIEESEFATGLVHRIRDCTKRMRLGAPKLIGKSAGLDPNTVADYLDNTLPPERSPDFEKVCLESDVHLAEVAACHQILTMVLGEPAQIDPASRRRMYAIPQIAAERAAGRGAGLATADPAHLDAEPADAADAGGLHGDELHEMAAQAAALQRGAAQGVENRDAATHARAGRSSEENGHDHPSTSRPRTLEVPDYLRKSSPARFWPLAATVLIAAGVTAAALAFRHPILALLGFEKPEQRIAQSGGGKEIGDSEGHGATSGSSTDKGDDDAAKNGGKTRNSTEAAKKTSPVTPDATKDAAAKGNNAEDGSDAPSPDRIPGPDKTPNGDDASRARVSRPSAIDSSDDKSSLVKPRESNPADGRPTDKTDDAVRPDSAGKADKTGASGKPTDGRTTPQGDGVGPIGGVVGKMLSEDQVLFRREAKAIEWTRVGAGKVLTAGDRLVAMPGFRPKITLSSGVTLQLAGGTVVELGAADAAGTVALDLLQGRLVHAMTGGQAGVGLYLRAADRRGTLVFGDVDSMVAVDLRRQYDLGADPTGATALAVVDVYVTGGQIGWRDEGATKVETVRAGSRMGLAGRSAARVDPAAQVPKWIESEQLTDLERRAIDNVEHDIRAGQPIGLPMKELVNGSRIHERLLAARGLACLGQFGGLMAAVTDDSKTFSWVWRQKFIDSFRGAALAGPKEAADVRDAMRKSFGDQDGDELFRMLCGYSAADLKAGADLRLVDALGHKDLSYRALAIFNLEKITGTTRNYSPEKPLAARKASMQVWKGRQQSGQVAYKDGKEAATKEPAAKTDKADKPDAKSDAKTPPPAEPPTDAPPENNDGK